MLLVDKSIYRNYDRMIGNLLRQARYATSDSEELCLSTAPTRSAVFKGSTVNAKIATEHGYLNNRCSKIARSWRQMYAQYAMPLTMASSFVICIGGDSGQSFQ